MEKQTSKVYVYLTYIFLAIAVILLYAYLSKQCGICEGQRVSSDSPYLTPSSLSTSACNDLNATKLVCHLDIVGNYICIGEVTNNCNIDFKYVELIGTYYKDGELVGTSNSFVSTQGLKAGETSSFTLYTTNNGVIFDNYKLKIDAS